MRKTLVGNYIGSQVLESAVLNANVEEIWKIKGFSEDVATETAGNSSSKSK